MGSSTNGTTGGLDQNSVDQFLQYLQSPGMGAAGQQAAPMPQMAQQGAPGPSNLPGQLGHYTAAGQGMGPPPMMSPYEIRGFPTLRAGPFHEFAPDYNSAAWTTPISQALPPKTPKTKNVPGKKSSPGGKPPVNTPDKPIRDRGGIIGGDRGR